MGVNGSSGGTMSVQAQIDAVTAFAENHSRESLPVSWSEFLGLAIEVVQAAEKRAERADLSARKARRRLRATKKRVLSLEESLAWHENSALEASRKLNRIPRFIRRFL